MSNIAYRSGPQCYPPPNFAGQTAWLLVLVITAGGQHQLGTLHLVQHLQYSTVQYSTIQYSTVGTKLVLGPPKKFYRRNLSGTLRDVHWYHLGDPKKVPGAPSQGFLIFLGFDKIITKIEIWL